MHLPYRALGAAGAWPLLAASAGAGAIVSLALTALWPRLAPAGADTVVLSGISDDARTENNETIVKRGQARAILGPTSLLVLWAWTTSREGSPSTADTAAFFASALPARR